MALDPTLRGQLTLPAICAPMFLVTGPALVREACKAGVIGGLPRQNARSFERFEAWLAEISADLDAFRAENPTARVAPVAVNLATRLPPDELAAHLEVCRRHGVEIIISATGDPTELVGRVHDWGGKVFHDVTNLRFAEKAIAAGADGLTCIGAGGGGHSGTISHLASRKAHQKQRFARRRPRPVFWSRFPFQGAIYRSRSLPKMTRPRVGNPLGLKVFSMW